MLHDIGFIDILEIDRDSCSVLCKEFSDFQVVRSLLAFRAVDIPTLDALIVFGLNATTECNLAKRIEEKGWNKVMLRRDIPAGRHGKKRGGFTYPASRVMSEIRSSLHNGYLIILHPPYSRYDNLYSGNVLLSRNEHKVYVELVTSGFDLSDLNRGDSDPHERFVIREPTEVESWGCLSPSDVLKHEIIDKWRYKNSWLGRMRKVAYEISKRGCKFSQANLEENLKTILEERGEPLLFSVQDHPEPLGYEQLCLLYEYAAIFFMYAREFGFCESELSLGFGKPAKAHLIFWSVFAR